MATDQSVESKKVMARFRIYPSANSVLFEDDTDRNVGINEVFELWYGQSGTTRAVFSWDWQYYIDSYTDGIAPALTATTVNSLKTIFTCTFPILQQDLSVGGANYVLEYPDTTTYPTDFDEGEGWYLEGAGIITGVPNWNSATTVVAWPVTGAGTSLALTGVAASNRAAELISFTPGDTTNTYANIWSGYVVPNEKVITVFRFADDYEALTGSTAKKRLFFSRHTHTHFLPYMEVNWDDSVKEDRENIIEGITSSLYLFVYSAGTLADPASVDSVTILGTTDTSNISKVSKGIYKYDYVLPTDSGTTGTVITDTWAVTYTGSLTGTIAQTFTGLSIANTTLWSGDTILAAQPYQVSLPNLEEEYSKNSIVYVRCKFRREFQSGYNLVKDAQFRVHIPNGDTGEPELIMYDWSPISYRGDENFFQLTLSWFLTGQTYQVDVRYGDGHSKIYDQTERKFKVTL
jgi:hypothetical protein